MRLSLGEAPRVPLQKNSFLALDANNTVITNKKN